MQNTTMMQIVSRIFPLLLASALCACSTSNSNAPTQAESPDQTDNNTAPDVETGEVETSEVETGPVGTGQGGTGQGTGNQATSSQDSGNSSSQDNPDINPDGTPSTTPSSVQRLPSGGHVSDPEFQWPATAGASSYRLIILDDRGDRISEQLTAQQASCLDTTVMCRFKPSVQIHDSILKWRTQAFDANGEWIETSEDVSFSTLRSLTAQPYTALDNIGAPPNPGHGFPTIEFDQFVVLNNDWNARAVNSDSWQQTVAVDRLQNGNAQIVFEYDWLTQSDGDEFAVKSYPQVVYGNKLGAHVSGTPEELGLPARVADLDDFRIDYRFTETGNAERNLAFESFFHTDCDIGGPNFDVDDREYEMMVWIANPSIRTPGSTKAESGVMIDDQLWDVWIKPLQDKSYLAFTAVNEANTGTLNWKRFVDWTVDWSAVNQQRYDIKALDTNWCMAAIEFGVETWWGAAKLQLDELKITRQ